MAYVNSYSIMENAAGGSTSVALTLPAHVANDILLCIPTFNGSTTLTLSGWSQVGTTQTANAGITSAMFWKRAAGSSETGTLTAGTADDYAITTLCIKDVDTTTAIDASTTTNSGTVTASQFTSPSVTTTTNDCLIIYAHGLDGTTPAVHSNPGVHFIISNDSTGTAATTSAAHGIAWYVQRTAGTTPTPGWTISVSAVRTNLVVAFRNKSGGIIPAYIDDYTDVPTAILGGHHFSTLNGATFPGALTLNNIGPGGSGKTTTYDVAAAVGDYGINPYSSALSSTPATTASTAVAGFEVTFSPTLNFSSGFFVGSVIANTPKIANYNLGSVLEGGLYLTVGSSGTNTNYRSYQVATRDSFPNTSRRMIWSIDSSQSGTAYGTNGTYASTAVSKILFASNCPTAGITLYTCEWFHVKRLIVAGGTDTSPVDSLGLYSVGTSFRLPVIERSGASGLLSYVPLQIGGGDAVIFKIDAGALLFPRIYDQTTKELNFHAAANSIGISYAGKSGDTIEHTNSVVTSPSPYYWEINSAATNAATWNFSGLTVSGANVTLRNVTTFNNMAFSSCPSITATGCTVTNSKISKPPATNDSLVGGTFTGITFDTTTITAGNRLTSVSSPTVFTSCIFNGSNSTGHAIRITSPGTYSLNGLTFNSYAGQPGSNDTPSSGSNSAAIFNDSGGLVTLNIINGGSSVTVRNGASATTVVNQNVNITLTGLKNPTEVRVFSTGTTNEVSGTGGENITSGSHTFSVASGVGYDISILALGYQNIRMINYSSTSDASVPISQVLDRQYLNP